MSVVTTIAATLSTEETLETNVPAGATGGKTIKHTGFSIAAFQLNGASTPTATKCAYFTVTLSEGAATVDLTALTGTNGATVTGSGLKPRGVLIKNPASNSPIAITEGASNGHPLLGAAFLVGLKQKQWLLMYLEDQATAVGGTDKTWDVTGTGSESFQVAVVFG